MGHHSCCNKQKVKRGLWSPEEDEKLINYISNYGHGCWSSVPRLAGLQRCGKSCRLRWINYLRPDLKRGSFSPQEAALIIELHRILGNRWAQIAKHLPGRTDNEVKNFWNSSIKKKLVSHGFSDHFSTFPNLPAINPNVSYDVFSYPLNPNPNLIPNPQPQQDLFYIPTPTPPILQPFDHNHDDNNNLHYNLNLVSVLPPVTLPLGSRSSYDPAWPSGCQPQQIDHHQQQQLYNLDPPMFPVVPKHSNVNLLPAQEEEGDPINVSLSCLTPTRVPSNELEFMEAIIMSSLPLPPPPASSTSSKSSSSSSPSSTLTPLSSCSQFVVNPNFTSSWGP
ncbi:hypothetical protein LguiA_028786 [Lonicera macranthoides]